MKLMHYIEMRVFSKEGDNEEQIVSKIKELFPFDFKKDKIRFSQRTAYGFDDKKIKILTVTLDRDRHNNKFIQDFFSRLSDEQKGLLLKQIESRMDEKLHFYIRLEKDKLMNGEYWLTDSGNCFHFTFAIAAYPHRKEVAKDIIAKILTS
jgi:RNA binding exosome subunit